MALIKQETIQGIEANYWKVLTIYSLIDKNFINDVLQLPEETLVTVALYKDADVRQEDMANFFYSKNMKLDGIYQTRDECYEALKSTEFFKDAVDG